MIDDAWERGLSLAVVVRRHRQVLFHAATEGTSPGNDQWLARKRRVVELCARSWRRVGLQGVHDGGSFAQWWGLDPAGEPGRLTRGNSVRGPPRAVRAGEQHGAGRRRGGRARRPSEGRRARRHTGRKLSERDGRDIPRRHTRLVNLVRLSAVTTLDTEGAAIAAAKERWLRACGDGSSSAVVQELYGTYRDLVISQVASIATAGSRGSIGA